jgi:catechol 2,3-dioxygenase-like lactoylglutathione lyase family enzyme
MSTLAGVNHITVLTGELDRLAAFYEDVFGARKLMELPVPAPDGPGRHALIGIGGGAVLHLFELQRVAIPPARAMFGRGRIDHFALQVSDARTLERLRAELLKRGATDGTVTDFGVVRVLTFTDPDGHAVELAHWVGGTHPGGLDMSRASDDQLTARRAARAARDPTSRRGSDRPTGGFDEALRRR